MIKCEINIAFFSLNKKLGFEFEDRAKHIVILIKNDKQTYGVIVEDIISQQQVVIKKISDDAKFLPGFLGSSIMGNGRPALILDFYEMFGQDMQSPISSDNQNKLREM